MQPTEDTLGQHLRLNPNNHCICAVCTLYSLHRGLANQVNIAPFQLANLRRRVNEANQPNARGNQDKSSLGQRPGLTPRRTRVCCGWSQRQVSTKDVSYKPTVAAMIFGQSAKRNTTGCPCTQRATMRPTVVAQIPPRRLDT